MTSRLTKKEKEVISQIVQDNESGHHFLHKRSDEYKELRYHLSMLLAQSNTINFSDRDFEMCDYYWACTDPKYMKIYAEKYKKN